MLRSYISQARADIVPLPAGFILNSPSLTLYLRGDGHLGFVGGLGVLASLLAVPGHLLDGLGVEAGDALEAFHRLDAGPVLLVLGQARGGHRDFLSVLWEP